MVDFSFCAHARILSLVGWSRREDVLLMPGDALGERLAQTLLALYLNGDSKAARLILCIALFR